MIAMSHPRAGRLAVGLGALALLGLAMFGTGDTWSDAAQPVAAAPACASCDARHGRLADLRVAQPELAE
jgi:hypothetical protein